MVRVLTKPQRSTQNVRLFFVLISLFSVLPRRIQCQSSQPSSADTIHINQLYRTAFNFLNVNNDSAQLRSRQVIRDAQRIRYATGVAKGYALMGAVMRNRGEFDSSIYYAQKALPLFESQHQTEGIANVYNLMAMTYKRMGDAQRVKPLTQKAMTYASLAKQYAIDGQHYSELSRAYNTLGITYRDMNQFDSAKVYYQRAIAVELQHHPEPSYLPIGYANYGQILMDADRNFSVAIQYYQRAIPLYEQENNLTGLEHAYRNLSWAYRQQGDVKRAMVTADKALALGRTVNDPHRLVNSLEAAYLAYRSAGQYKTAIAFLEEWKNREDSLLNVQKTRTIATLEATYQTEKKQAQIDQLAAKNEHDLRQIAYLIAGLIVLGLLFSGLLWQFQTLRRSRIQIRQQSDQLALMMKELHHRVKNNLSIVSGLLRLQATHLTDDHVIQAVRTGQQRVEAMVLIHQRLYQASNMTTVNMQEYLTDLVYSLMQAYGYGHNDVDVQLAITKEWLEADTAVPIGLIVNELVTNSFKHAYPSVSRPMLRIGLHEQEGLLLEVQDNGPGITPAEWQQSTHSSFGKQLIESLCKQLAGVLEVRQQNGALFRMHFPNVT